MWLVEFDGQIFTSAAKSATFRLYPSRSRQNHAVEDPHAVARTHLHVKFLLLQEAFPLHHHELNKVAAGQQTCVGREQSWPALGARNCWPSQDDKQPDAHGVQRRLCNCSAAAAISAEGGGQRAAAARPRQVRSCKSASLHLHWLPCLSAAGALHTHAYACCRLQQPVDLLMKHIDLTDERRVPAPQHAQHSYWTPRTPLRPSLYLAYTRQPCPSSLHPQGWSHTCRRSLLRIYMTPGHGQPHSQRRKLQRVEEHDTAAASSGPAAREAAALCTNHMPAHLQQLLAARGRLLQDMARSKALSGADADLQQCCTMHEVRCRCCGMPLEAAWFQEVVRMPGTVT